MTVIIPTYQVTSVSSFKDFTYLPGDSSITVFVKIQSFESVKQVYFNIYSSDSKKINSSVVNLFDDGKTAEHGDFTASDGTFTNKFPLSQSYPVGNYLIEFFVDDVEGETKKAAVQKFFYDNGQSNVAPVISDLVAPDSVTVVDPKSVIFISIKATDANGLNDIRSVNFTSRKPDSTIAGTIEMFDDGGAKSGDQTASDGIYSVLIEVTPQNQKGIYTFDFKAEDQRKAVSNIISHKINIK